MDLDSYRPSDYPCILRIPVLMAEVERARRVLAKDLESNGVTGELSRHICLVLDEALTNAIEHGSSKVDSQVEVAYKIADGWIEIAVTDHGGIVFNPEYFEQLATVKNWGAGGRGILLIRKLVDEVYFVFTPGQSTRIIMRKKLSESL